MGCAFCAGVRRCVHHHPPLVTFVLSLVTLAATFLCYGIYIRTYPVKDADFTKDFDTVLQTLSASKICPQRNVTGPLTSQGSPVGSTSDDEDVAGVSVLAGVTLSPWQPSVNHSSLQIRATASQLGMKGPGTDSYLLVTVTSGWWSARCNDSDGECSGKYCVTVSGPPSVLPQSWSALQCTTTTPSRRQVLPELYAVVETDLPEKCLSLQYRGDPALKATMSQEDCAVSSGRLLAAALCCLLIALLLFVVSGCWSLHIKDKRTPGTL